MASLVQSLLSEPYETVFADPPVAHGARATIRNLDTGEVRFFDDDQRALTESFQEGHYVEPQRLAGRRVVPWLSWWSQKHARDELVLDVAAAGNPKAVEAALKPPVDGEAPASVDARGRDGRTAMQVACEAGHTDVVKVLVGARADLHATSAGGMTALHSVCQRGHIDCILPLVEGGVSALRRSEHGNLPIHLAAMNGHVEVVSILVGAAGMDQLATRNYAGHRPSEVCSNLKTTQAFERLDPACAKDSFVTRSTAAGGKMHRNSRADFVQRLMAMAKQVAALDNDGVGPSFAEPDPSPTPSPTASPPAGSVASSWTCRSRQSRRSFGMRTPRTPGRGVRGSFAKVSATDNPKVERLGPTSFEVVTMLGRGSFGEVYKVKHKSTGEIYAMKVLQKTKIQSKNLQRYAMSERNILSYVRHPYIVSLHYAFQTSSCLVMVLQFCSRGNLQQLISKEKKLQEPVAKIYTAEILLALIHLHERRIIFRDLKPDNIVLDEDNHAKLTDFGLSKEGVGDRGAKTFCGSVAFLAPEILARKEHNHTVDIYDLGVLLFNMLTGLPPFYHNDRETLFANIRHARLEVPRYVPAPAKELILATMQRDATRRLGAQRTSDVKGHSFFNGVDFEALMRREIPMPNEASAAPEHRDSIGSRGPMFRGLSPNFLGAEERLAAGRARVDADSAGGTPYQGWDYLALPESAEAAAAGRGAQGQRAAARLTIPSVMKRSSRQNTFS